MFAPGKFLDNRRYEIVGAVGGGSQGTVYEATDSVLDRTVALKSVSYDEDSPVEVLSSEARLLAQLGKHPALPTVYDYFSEDGFHFLVMEFVPGDDLFSALKNRGRPFPIHQVLKWAFRLLSALEHIHNSNPPIIHRDVKPQNLKLDNRGEIVLLDFGLAKSLLKGTKIFGFTASYAPLEQLQGRPTDARSDLYSLAASLYHLSTNLKPIDAKSRQIALERCLPDPLVPPHEIVGSIPTTISQAIMKGMSIETVNRPNSAPEFRKLFESDEETLISQIKSEASTLVNPTFQSDPSAETQQPRYRLLGQTEGHILSLAFSPNGKWLASGGWDQRIHLWNLETGDFEVLARCEGPVNSIFFSPDSSSLASASKNIEVWDVRTKKNLKRINQFGFCVTFSPQGRYLAWSSKAASTLEGSICTWDLEENRVEVLGTSQRW